MPSIPATRKRILKHANDDKIQNKLRKKYDRINPIQQGNATTTTTVKTTLDIAQAFIKLLNNSNNEAQKISDIVKDIRDLHSTLSFSTRQFIDHVLTHALNYIRLLECYYKVYAQLPILCLSLYTILDRIPHLKQSFLELVSYEEDIAEAYIPYLNKDLLKEYMEENGKLLVHFRTKAIKRENASCLLYILKYQHGFMKEDQLMMQLLSLHSDHACNSLSDLYKLKQYVFSHSRQRDPNYNAILIKLPVCELVSTWFYEFNANSTFKLIDFISHIVYLNSQSSESLDVSFLLYVYDIGCQKLKREGKDALRIFDIIELLNQAVTKSLGKDVTHNELPFLLTVAQITLEHLHSSIGYSYMTWFESLLTQSNSILGSKRSSLIFIKVLQQLVPFEIPSLLQIHGKAIYNSSIGNTTEYIPAVKKRLIELGVNHSLQKYPESLCLPIPLLKETIVVRDDDDMVKSSIEQFKEKNTIPTSLLQSHIFKKQWFYATFLPRLLEWQGPLKKERDELVKALKDHQKIPEAMYQDFIQKKRKV